MGLEILVRPLNIPDTTPRALPSLAPDGDGPVTLTGSSARLIDLHHSSSYSKNRQLRKREIHRVYDVNRIYHMDDEGTIDKSQFVDVENVRGLRLRRSDGQQETIRFAKPPGAPNVEPISVANTRTADDA